jgi:hypothetical protein
VGAEGGEAAAAASDTFVVFLLEPNEVNGQRASKGKRKALKHLLRSMVDNSTTFSATTPYHRADGGTAAHTCAATATTTTATATTATATVTTSMVVAIIVFLL